MLLINKILVVLNLLGAFVFMVLLSTDNLRRNEWVRATEIGRQVNEGLTLNKDDKDKDAENLTDRNDDKVQKALRLDANLKTQSAAVQELKQKVDARLDAFKDDPRRLLGETARFLLPLAESYTARERLQELRSYQAPDLINKRLADQVEQALTATLEKVGPTEKGKAREAFEKTFRREMQLAGPGEGKRLLASAVVRVLVKKADETGKQRGVPGDDVLAAALAAGKAGGKDGVANFLREVRGADTSQTGPALLEATFFDADNQLLETTLADAIRPALDALRNPEGDAPFFGFGRTGKKEKPADNETPQQLAERQLRLKTEAALAELPALSDAERRRVGFRAAYLGAVAAQPGEPRDPYAMALVDLLTADPARLEAAFDAAKLAWPPTEAGQGPARASEATALAFVKKLVGSEGGPGGEGGSETVEAVLAPRVNEAVTRLANDLREDLKQEFELALNPKAIPRRAPVGVKEEGKPASPDVVQRAAAAKVLLSLADVPLEAPSAWQPAPAESASASDELTEPMKRAMRIVGLHAAASELARQASVLERMPAQIRARLLQDREDFAMAHLLLESRVQNAAVAARLQVAEVKRYEDFIKAREAVVGQPGQMKGRYADVEAFQKRLEEEQRVTQDRLAQLERMSRSLFEIRKEVRDAIRLTQQYEDGIRYLEARQR